MKTDDFKITLVPDKNAFYIDVGDMDPKEVLAYLERVRDEYMKTKQKKTTF